MKLAYIGIDLLYPALPALKAACEVCEIFTCETDNETEFNLQVRGFAEKNGIPLTVGRITAKDIKRLKNEGCDVLVCGGYYYRIPIDRELRAVNIHPSLLPSGRGAWPMPVTILRGLGESGVTVHKMTEEFDRGDILLRKRITVAPDENLQTLTAKQQALLPEMMKELAGDFDRLYSHALPQGEGEYWPCPSESGYPVTPDMEICEADRILRAFYGYECIYKNDTGCYGLIKGKAVADTTKGTAPQPLPPKGNRFIFPVRGGWITGEGIRRL